MENQAYNFLISSCIFADFSRQLLPITIFSFYTGEGHKLTLSCLVGMPIYALSEYRCHSRAGGIHSGRPAANPLAQSLPLWKWGAGLDFIGLGQPEDYKKTVENPDLWHPTKAFEVVVEYGN